MINRNVEVLTGCALGVGTEASFALSALRAFICHNIWCTAAQACAILRIATHHAVGTCSGSWIRAAAWATCDTSAVPTVWYGSSSARGAWLAIQTRTTAAAERTLRLCSADISTSCAWCTLEGRKTRRVLLIDNEGARTRQALLAIVRIHAGSARRAHTSCFVLSWRARTLQILRDLRRRTRLAALCIVVRYCGRRHTLLADSVFRVAALRAVDTCSGSRIRAAAWATCDTGAVTTTWYSASGASGA
jgi:hypothetical protein